MESREEFCVPEGAGRRTELKQAFAIRNGPFLLIYTKYLIYNFFTQTPRKYYLKSLTGRGRTLSRSAEPPFEIKCLHHIQDVGFKFRGTGRLSNTVECLLVDML